MCIRDRDRDNLERAMSDVRDELGERLRLFQSQNKLVEAQRLEQRTQLDLEMMQELGYCTGIENYSRHLDGRKEGDPPATLLDYFPDDFVPVSYTHLPAGLLAISTSVWSPAVLGNR